MIDQRFAVAANPNFSKLRSSLRGKFLKDAAVLTIGRGINLLVGTLSMLIFGVVMNKPDIAVISLFEMCVGLAMTLGVTWNASGIVRFGKAELHNDGTLNKTATTRLYVTFPFVLIACVLVLIFHSELIQYLNVSSDAFAWALCCSLLICALHDHLSAILLAREEHLKNTLFFVGQAVTKLVVVSAFLLRWFEADPFNYVVALVIGDTLLLGLRLPGCRGSLYPLLPATRQDLLSFFRYTSPQLFGFAGIYVVNWIDVYFIREYGGMSALGAYQFLYTVFMKFAMFAFVANALLFPRIMEWKKKDPSKISRFLEFWPLRVLVCMSVLSLLGVALFPLGFGIVFGDKYSIAYPAFAILVLTLPCYFFSYCLIPVLNSFDHVKYVQCANLLAAGVNLVIDFLLVASWGVTGAGVATFLAYWTKAVMLLILMHLFFGMRIRSLGFLLLFLLLLVLVGFGSGAPDVP